MDIPLPFDTLNFQGSEDEGRVLPDVDAQTWFSPNVPSSPSSAAERFGSKMSNTMKDTK